MSDDATKLGAFDRARINLDQDFERRAWAKALGVTDDPLAQAVHNVGDRADKVWEYLGITHNRRDPAAPDIPECDGNRKYAPRLVQIAKEAMQAAHHLRLSNRGAEGSSLLDHQICFGDPNETDQRGDS